MGEHDVVLQVPQSARAVLEALEAAGHEAWVVGGWVRDALRGAPVHDVDVTTSASWQQSKRALEAAGMRVHETGTAHGTVTAMSFGEPIEVTTYRVEGPYSDLRHPDYVRYVDDVCEDLARRDLTINAMAYHPTRGLLDPFGGRGDLERRLIRAVGEPSERFSEDALRVLRAVRFSQCMGYAVEHHTQEALATCAHLLQSVATERIGAELRRIVEGGHAGRALIEQREVMCAALPELSACVGFDQRSVYHIYDVYEHTAHVCCATEAFTASLAPASLRWAALLHDIGKPVTFSEDEAGHGHFFGHPREGARIARRVLHRLAIPQEIGDVTCCLISMHDDRIEKTPKAMRRMLRRIAKACPGRETEVAFQLLNLRRADAVAKGPGATAWAHRADDYARLLRDEVRQGPVFSTSQLAIGGKDVMDALGLAAGPVVGMQLDMALAAVMDGIVPNERETILAWLTGN